LTAKDLARLSSVRIVRAERSALPPAERDHALADMVVAETAGAPSFVYAIKRGAHYPYDEAVPPGRTRRTAAAAIALGFRSEEAAIAARYLDAISFAVDEFFADLLPRLADRDILVFYMSDHAESLLEDGRTRAHCSEGPAPAEQGRVPLLVWASGGAVRNLADVVAPRGHVSAYRLHPTLVRTMGYAPATPTLFGESEDRQRFYSGDPVSFLPEMKDRVAVGLFLAVASSSCSEPRAGIVAAPSPPAIAPNAEPLPPQLVPEDGRLALDTEYWLGSEEEENASFTAFSARIREIQDKAATDNRQPVQRGFHAKSHGCLSGELQLDPHRDPRTRFGVFADDAGTRRVVVRFSNGVGWKQGDSELDARGMAVKVLDVPGPKYQPDEQNTQDFLMTNTPVPVGRDSVEFMEFAKANVKGRAAGLLFLVGHASNVAAALSRATPVDSMVTERYWSGSAYHLGAHQAVKIATRPCDLHLVREPNRSSDDYLREDLVVAAKDGICMQMYVQFQVDPTRTPIENASRIWEETDAPIVPVARVVMPPQTIASASTPACDQLSFTPWHAIPAHKPMGNINRARRFVYDASRVYRHGGGDPAR